MFEAVVAVNLPHELLGLRHDSINALGPFGRSLSMGFGATQRN